MKVCEQILRRMHDALDRREKPLNDPLVRSHVKHCPSCRQAVQLWTQIEDQLPAVLEIATRREAVATTAEPQRRWSRQQMVAWKTGIAVAASVLCIGLGVRFAVPVQGPAAPPGVTQDGTPKNWAGDDRPAAAVASGSNLAWLDRTKPVVQRTVPMVRRTGKDVGRGVAPLGRSLSQAVAILSNGR
ncbi:MAG: hypothetical protein AAF958_16595 [Planctomycetota bacterium]